PAATMRTPGAALSTLSIAPVPRPPHPLTPTRISSLPWAQTPDAGRAEASVPPTTAALEVLRKSRREAPEPRCSFSVMLRLREDDGGKLLPDGWFVHAEAARYGWSHPYRAETGAGPEREGAGWLRFRDHPEADEGGVGVPPEALGNLRIAAAPGLARGPSRRTAQRGRIVVPGAAPDRVRIQLLARIVERIVLRRPRVEVRLVEIGRPLGDVAVHVVQPEGVGLLLSADVRLSVAVRPVPGVLVERRRVVAERVGRRRAGPCGVLPLRFGRQTVLPSGASREPLTVLRRRVLRDADDRLVVLAPPPGLVGVRRRRPRYRVAGILRPRQAEPALPPQVEAERELVEVVPGDPLGRHEGRLDG